MKKVNDIYNNLKEKINLKSWDSFLGTMKNLDPKKNIDSLKKWLKNIVYKKKRKLNTQEK